MLHIRKSKKMLPLLLFLILAVILSGCSNEKKIEVEDAEITVKSDDETIEITSDDESMQAEINLGGATDLPDGYPEKVFPIYPNSDVLMAQTMNSDGISSYSVMLKNKDEAEKIYAYYKELLKDGENLMDMNTQGTHTLAGSLDGYNFGIVIGPNNLDSEEVTMIQITLSEE